MPLFVAIIKIGDMSLSNARFKNEKHSISNMWTSSINRTFDKSNIKKWSNREMHHLCRKIQCRNQYSGKVIGQPRSLSILTL